MPTKPCVVCGRVITWRKKWERDWESVKYCSDRCRRTGLADTDTRLELAIMALLTGRDGANGSRRAPASICPSDAARLVAPGPSEAAWRPLMEPARAAARRLVAQGRVVITQGGTVVDPSTAKGPIRVALKG
jgi:hypothetical protein